MNVPSTDLPEAPTSWALRFTLGDWNNHASVRTSRHDYRLPEDLQLQLQTRFWFPPAFLPYLSHPAIEAAGSKIMHRLAASHLVHFLTTPRCLNTASSTAPWKPSSTASCPRTFLHG